MLEAFATAGEVSLAGAEIVAGASVGAEGFHRVGEGSDLRAGFVGIFGLGEFLEFTEDLTVGEVGIGDGLVMLEPAEVIGEGGAADLGEDGEGGLPLALFPHLKSESKGAHGGDDGFGFLGDVGEGWGWDAAENLCEAAEFEDVGVLAVCAFEVGKSLGGEAAAFSRASVEEGGGGTFECGPAAAGFWEVGVLSEGVEGLRGVFKVAVGYEVAGGLPRLGDFLALVRIGIEVVGLGLVIF